MEYDVIICFETHVELKTLSKLFCDCKVMYDAPPNTHICPVCTGQPGALPVLNKKAVEYTIMAGLALNCTINHVSEFARKNYFYPDLPKGYQISQYETPFCENGFLEITGDNGKPYPVGIKRIHLEEDAGKLVHSSKSFEEADYSLVDYNRSSVPLIEIVCDHENNPLRSISEARTYLEKLRHILRYIGISDCMMERGQLRCDVNISLRPKGTVTFGNRTEIKNMSSFRFIMEALESEINRQKEILNSGGHIEQETRLFDETSKKTFLMRSKEDAPDYRYFPDPDLVEVNIDEGFIDNLRQKMPELPDQYLNRIIQEFGIPKNDALIITKEKDISDFFSACAPMCADKKRLSNWIIKELFRVLNDKSSALSETKITPDRFSALINMITSGEITEPIARSVLQEMLDSDDSPEAIVEKRGLKPVSDTETLKKIITEVIKENALVVERIKSGETKAIDFLVGQVMKKTRGKANAKKAKDLICSTLEI